MTTDRRSRVASTAANPRNRPTVGGARGGSNESPADKIAALRSRHRALETAIANAQARHDQAQSNMQRAQNELSVLGFEVDGGEAFADWFDRQGGMISASIEEAEQEMREAAC